MAKQELLATIRDRYQESSKKEKGRILDEFMAVTGHRKYGIRLLAQIGYDAGKSPVVKGRRIYDEAVREAVIVVWAAADRICGKRLKAALPNLVESMERHASATAGGPCSSSSAPERLAATGDPAAGGLYLRGLAREGVALRREILRFLTRLRSQSGLAPVDFSRYTTMLS